MSKDAGRLTPVLPTSETWSMGRSIALGEVLDKHQIRCPRCECREAIVLLDAHFNVHWQCVECEWRWAASEEESVLLLNSTSKTVH